MSRGLIKLLVLAIFLLTIVQAQTPAGDQLPTFRTGIDIIQLDVSVLDKDRRPVRGLTASDFTILERGKPQPIVAFAAIDVPAPVVGASPWMRDAPVDVVSNDTANRRLVTIVMDDAYTLLEPDIMKRAKMIARNAIDQLGPSDLAAVVFTLQGRSQNFTSDRSALIAAVDSFVPKTTGAAGPPTACMVRLRSCDVDTLSTVASTLVTGPPGRKIVILVSGGRSFSFGDMGDASSRNEAPELDRMFRNLQRGNVTVYAFDAHGLQVGGATAADRAPRPMSAPENDSLYSFAGSTGGRAVSNMNDPENKVAGAFGETTAYYLLGFQSAAQPDGSLHKIEVKTNRPGVEVRTRSGYYAPKKNEKRATDEIANGLPGGDLPIHVTTAVVAHPGSADAEVVVVTRIERVAEDGGSRKASLIVSAFDRDMKPRGAHRQTFDIVSSRPGSRAPDVPSHLPLRPGRYLVHVAAESEGHSGNVYVDVEVPDFKKESLAVSGLMIERAPAIRVADKALGALLQTVPTTRREFRTTDDVKAYLRVHQGGKARVAPVRMIARVLNSRNGVSSTQESVLEVEQFGPERAADYRVSLPLSHLDPGDYLLQIDAQSGVRKVRQSARFTVGTER